jgi:hypothetical protein
LLFEYPTTCIALIWKFDTSLLDALLNMHMKLLPTNFFNNHHRILLPIPLSTSYLCYARDDCVFALFDFLGPEFLRLQGGGFGIAGALWIGGPFPKLLRCSSDFLMFSLYFKACCATFFECDERFHSYFTKRRGHGWRDTDMRSREEVREEGHMGTARAKQVSGTRWHLYFCMKSLPFDGFDSYFNNTAA